MEEQKTPIIDSNQLTCSNCNAIISSTDNFCTACGFPEKGTDEEKAKFHAKSVMKKNKHIDAGKKVKSAQITLYVVGGITGLFGVILYFVQEDMATLITNIILSAIYVALGLWCNKKPLAALLSGLLLYITILVFNAMIEPASLYKGIIWKILILTYLGKGLYSAKAAQKIMEEENAAVE